jgi:hypothetical protein
MVTIVRAWLPQSRHGYLSPGMVTYRDALHLISVVTNESNCLSIHVCPLGYLTVA